MRVKSFPEKLAKWECVDTQDPSLGLFIIIDMNFIAHRS